MQSALQPYATAGVAIVGASLVVVTPVAALSPQIQAVRDVALTAGESSDLLAPWIDQYNAASTSLSTILNNFLLAPDVGLQQVLKNQTDFTQQVFNDPSSITSVTQETQDNLKGILTGFTDASVSLKGQEVATYTTAGNHNLLFSFLPDFLPADDKATVEPILNFLASPASGVLLAQLGPVLAPWVALANSISDHDSFNEILANTVGAYFNGATIDLNSLLPAINSAGFLPAPIELTHLDLALPGLFSDGAINAGPFHLYDAAGHAVDTVPGVGGSIFNSIGLDLNNVPVLGTLSAPSEAAGPLAMSQGISTMIGQMLGANWTGKNAAAVPPGTLVHFPTLPTGGLPTDGNTMAVDPSTFGSFFDDEFPDAGGTGATTGADLSNLVQDFLTGVGL